MREAMVVHWGIDIDKTIVMLKEHFYWPRMAGDVCKVVSECAICRRTISTLIKGCILLFQYQIALKEK